MSYDADNPFARILRGVAPASIVYEDETQLCEAEVTVKLIDPTTGELIMQKSGRGYADTSTQEVMGLGDGQSVQLHFCFPLDRGSGKER